jgi:hypothetical protein
MAKKSKDIKNYLYNIGRTEQLHAFVGYTDEEVNKSTDNASLKLWQDMVFSKKISRGDVVGVIPNVTWTYGNVYIPWKSGIENTGAYYAWNRQNGNVYLCLQNNDINRDDLSGQFASTYIPNHAYGVQKYPDGYAWMPIYRITSEYLRFVKTNWIPVISFEDYEIYTEATEYQNASSFCDDPFLKNSARCGIYAKDNIRLPSTSNTFDYYKKGQLVNTFVTTCQYCYSLFKDNQDYQAVYYKTSAVPSTIQVESKLQLIGRLIGENKLPASSAFYALYDIASNGLADGAIVSTSIDLSAFNPDDLYVTTENPEISVSSYSGFDGRIRFKTYKNLLGKNVIHGIEVIQNGYGYRDVQLDISESIFETIGIKDLLISAVIVNYDIIDGLNVDPYDVLNCKNIQVDTRIDITELDSNSLLPSDTINLYGLVSNPLEETGTGDFIVSGSELSRFNTKIKNGYTTLVVTREGDELGPPVRTAIPKLGRAVVKDSSAKTIAEPRILNTFLSSKVFTPSAIQTLITVNNYEYGNISKTAKLTDSNNNTFTVNNILNVPTMKQYSGKILQSVKTNKNLKLSSSSGELSKVLRINMIKGI